MGNLPKWHFNISRIASQWVILDDLDLGEEGIGVHRRVWQLTYGVDRRGFCNSVGLAAVRQGRGQRREIHTHRLPSRLTTDTTSQMTSSLVWVVVWLSERFDMVTLFSTCWDEKVQ